FEPAYILSESLYAPLALGCVLAAWRLLEARSGDRSSRDAAAAGLVARATLLVRPEFALFIALLAFTLILRTQWRLAAILAIVTLVVVLPWPVYNVAARGRLVVLSSRGGPNFWMGNNALAVGDGDVASNPAMAREYTSIIRSNPALSAEAL